MANESTATAGACSSDPKHLEYGVQLAASAGVYLQASVSDVATATLTVRQHKKPTPLK